MYISTGGCVTADKTASFLNQPLIVFLGVLCMPKVSVQNDHRKSHATYVVHVRTTYNVIKGDPVDTSRGFEPPSPLAALDFAITLYFR